MGTLPRRTCRSSTGHFHRGCGDLEIDQSETNPCHVRLTYKAPHGYLVGMPAVPAPRFSQVRFFFVHRPSLLACPGNASKSARFGPRFKRPVMSGACRGARRIRQRPGLSCQTPQIQTPAQHHQHDAPQMAPRCTACQQHGRHNGTAVLHSTNALTPQHHKTTTPQHHTTVVQTTCCCSVVDTWALPSN